ncbi:phage late control D family protein [Aquisalimonas asiatica]|uniref:phage late control D family protein n=1 Tax=Aquisalimonas asiatica TaxID=406100 RepID=UPI00149616C2|nr:contractile injection system protein, VgrG/Pvc8 family [Aquisalimonas asiatica]
MDLTKHIADALIELRLEDRAGYESDALEIEVADNQDWTWPREGALLRLRALGYDGETLVEPASSSRFAIDQIEHAGPPARLHFSATSADFTSQMREGRDRSHPNMTLGELIERLAAEHGYDFGIYPADLGETHLGFVDQSGQSDLALAHQVAAEYGTLFKVIDGKWVVISYDATEGPDGEPIPVTELTPADVSTWRAHFMTKKKVGSVVATYQDYDLARRIPVTVGEGEPVRTLSRVFLDEATAQANARSTLHRAWRESRRLTINLPGNPSLASRQRLRLSGFRDGVNGDWLITQVSHVVNKRGYRCRVEAEGLGYADR